MDSNKKLTDIYPTSLKVVVDLEKLGVQNLNENKFTVIDGSQAVAVSVSISSNAFDANDIRVAVNQACRKVLQCYGL